MMGRSRRLYAVLSVLLLLLSVVVIGAFAGLESNTVSKSCLQQHESSASLHNREAAEACILSYLKEQGSSTKAFHVQGWRWHTLSLARDARRLGNLAASLNATMTGNESLQKAAYHVIGFNMKALHRVENKIFFPWLKEQLTSVDNPELADAFAAVLNDVVEEQRSVSKIGEQVMQQVDIVYSSSSSEEERMEAVDRIAALSLDLSSRLQHILQVEDLYLVPAVAILVSESKQRAFNNKVIFNMGVLDSRLHLVGMFEAVMEQGKEELELFAQEIPAIPRYMIPRWKRLLYDPQASVLEESSSQ